MRFRFLALAILSGVALAGCTSGELTNAVAGGFHGWCRQASNCDDYSRPRP